MDGFQAIFRKIGDMFVLVGIWSGFYIVEEKTRLMMLGLKTINQERVCFGSFSAFKEPIDGAGCTA